MGYDVLPGADFFAQGGKMISSNLMKLPNLGDYKP